MAVTLTELAIVIRAHASEISAEIEKGLKEAQHGTRAAATALGVAIGAGITGAAAAVAEAFKHGVEQVEAMRIAASKLGTSVNGIAQLQMAADMTGASFESLQSAIGKMEQNLATGKANDALGHLKLDAAEIRAMAPEKQFYEIAAALHEVGDQDAKMALGRKIFGKGFMEILPLINAGAEKLKEWNGLMERMGGTITPQMVAHIHEFHEETKLVGEVINRFTAVLAGEMAPLLTGFAAEMEHLVISWGGMQQVARDVAGAVEEVMTFALNAAFGFREIGVGLQIILAKALEIGGAFQSWVADGIVNALHGIAEMTRALAAMEPAVETGFRNMINTVIGLINIAVNALISGATGAMETMVNTAKSGFNEVSGIVGGPTLSASKFTAPAFGLPDLPTGEGGMSTSLIDAANDIDNVSASLADASKEMDQLGEGAKQTGEELQKSFGDPAWGEQFKANAEANKRIITQTHEAVNQSMLDVTEGADKAAKKHKELIQKVVKETNHAMEQMQSTNREAVTDLVTAWATGTGKMSDIIRAWAAQTIKTLISTMLFGSGGKGGAFGALAGNSGGIGAGLLGAAFGVVGGGVGSSAFASAALSGINSYGGAFAEGGDVTAGRRYLIGERGPEMFEPKQSGRIIPNKNLQGGGGNGGAMQPIIVQQNFQVGVSRIELSSILDGLEERTTAGVVAAYEKGGSFRRRLRA